MTSNHTPTFDLAINQFGRIELDLTGDGVPDFVATNLTTCGLVTYSVTASPLSEGAHTISARFLPNQGSVIQTSLVVTIVTHGPQVVGFSPSNSAPALLDHFDLTFDHAIDSSTLTLGALSLQRAFSGPIAITSISSVTGNTYRLSFAPLPGGIYSLGLAPTVTDLVGNALNQDGDDINGEPTEDAFRASFTIAVPDLIPKDIIAPERVWTDQPFTFLWTLQNIGGAPALRPWLDQAVLLAESPAGPDTLLAAFPGRSSLAPGEASSVKSREIFAPSTPGTYRIGLAVDSLDDVPEPGAEDNNVGRSAPILVTAYSVSVTPQVSVAPAGSRVGLNVRTFDPLTAQPAPNVPAVVCVSFHGTLRDTQSTVTDSSGLATVWFQSLPSDVGTFQAGAHRPSVSNCTAQASFVLAGLTVQPGQVQHRLIVGQPQTNEVVLINSSEAPLSGLNASASGLATNLSVSFALPPTLAANSTGRFQYVLLAANDRLRASSAHFTVATAQGASAGLDLDLEVAPAVPRLIADPASLQASVVRGSNTLVRLDLINDGGAPSGDLSVLLPSLPWLSVVSGRQLSSLAPGERRPVTLQLAPRLTESLGPVSGSLVVAGNLASVSIPFDFRIVSTLRGALQVTAVDEFTYYGEGAPKVTNATVVVMDPWNGSVITNGLTDASGTLLLTNLLDGYYRVEVRAPGHDDYHGTIVVRPDRTLQLTAFLPRRLVTYSWVVTPTDVPDHYTFTLRTTFETQVPVPVVTVDPGAIDLSTVTSNEVTVNLTIANHGLVAARGLVLSFGSHPSWQVSPDSRELGDLGPLSSIVLPVTLQRTQPAPGTGPCQIDAHLDWFFPCGPDNRYYRVPIIVFNASGDCRFVPPRLPPVDPLPPPIPGPVPVYPPPVEDVGCQVGCNPQFPHVIFPTFDVDLNFCDPCLGAVANCALNVAGNDIPLLTWLNRIDTLNDCVVRQQAPDCVKDLLGEIGSMGTLLTIKDCFCDITHDCAAPGPITDLVNRQCDRLNGLIDHLSALLGDSLWLRNRPGQLPLLEALLVQFAHALEAGSGQGPRISPAELSQLLALARPAQLQAAQVQALAARWNRSLDYWSAGIFNLAQVPAGQSTDFIALDRLAAGWTAAKSSLLANLGDGYTHVYDGVNDALDLLRQEFAPREGVCARVHLRIDQQAVLTRSAFNGALEINNFSGSLLENVSFQPDIRDTNGLPAEDRFGVRLREVTGFLGAQAGGLSLSNGAVLGGTSGQAIWLLVPATNAAPAGPTPYFIGGTLCYDQDGQRVCVPLLPERVVVYPSPILQVTYFLQRDVFGDDPFTPQIEPPEPFSLGLLIRNVGLGTARDMSITSARPQITDNNRDLLVDFQVLGTQVGAQPVSPSLTANLGNILPGSNAVARWLMSSSLSGRFVGNEATYWHVDDLGRPNLSLIDSVTVRDLIHVVLADTPGSDAIPDFLVDEHLANGLLPDTLYLSDGRIQSVTAVTNATVDGPPTAGDLTVRLTATVPAGWVYLRLADPGQGRFRLSRVVRSNGTDVLLDWNAWVTQRSPGVTGSVPQLHLLDYNSSGVYDLIYQVIPTDVLAPTSAVAALPAASLPQIPVRWDGQDNPGGSGVAGFDIYVNDNGGAFARWLSNTTLRGAVYLGTNGHTYGFYSVAIDVAGNREAVPATADARTTVSVTNTAPHLVPVADQHVREGDRFELTVIAVDAESPPQQLTFDLLSTPEGARIDHASGLISWVTGEAH
ncbi:MAG TPA: hypothetical protein VNH84_22405, partial [Candidatus Saccharimonadales bacterium]|nr:hypothetical protein [Candidatus Saccharimonadales bacterium]